MIEHYLSLAIENIFINNMILAYFLGMCSFLAISQNIRSSIGLGFAVIFVNGITVPINWVINNYLLSNNALFSWTKISGLENVNLTFLSFILFIATIAAT